MFLTTFSVIDGLAINMLFKDPRWFFISMLVVIFSICLHEFCHAFAALKMGDPTAAENGHLTLNPLRQMGLVSLVMLLIIGIAWGAVPVNPQNIRSRWRALLISVAGPLANLFLFVVAWVSFGILMNHVSAVKPIVLDVVLYLGLINGVLFLFNMLPVPGLDGWAVVQVFFRNIKLPDSEVLKGFFMILIFAAIFGIKYLFRLIQIIILAAPAVFVVKSLPDDARRGELKDVAIPLHEAYWHAEPPESACYHANGIKSISRREKTAILENLALDDLEISYMAQYGDIGLVILKNEKSDDAGLIYVMCRKEDGMWYIEDMPNAVNASQKFQDARRKAPLPEGISIPSDTEIIANARHYLPRGTVIFSMQKEVLYGGRDVIVSLKTGNPDGSKGDIQFSLEYHDGFPGWQIFPQK